MIEIARGRHIEKRNHPLRGDTSRSERCALALLPLQHRKMASMIERSEHLALPISGTLQQLPNPAQSYQLTEQRPITTLTANPPRNYCRPHFALKCKLPHLVARSSKSHKRPFPNFIGYKCALGEFI